MEFKILLHNQHTGESTNFLVTEEILDECDYGDLNLLISLVVTDDIDLFDADLITTASLLSDMVKTLFLSEKMEENHLDFLTTCIFMVSDIYNNKFTELTGSTVLELNIVLMKDNMVTIHVSSASAFISEKKEEAKEPKFRIISNDD